MDAFKLNKIAGAALSALLFIFGAKTLMEISHDSAAKRDYERISKTSYHLPVPKAAATKAAVKEEGFSFAKVVQLLPKASAENGEEVFRPCRACHAVDKGDTAAKQGPALWGIANRKVASVGGFNYSAGMKKHGGEWTWERLAQYLYDPKANVPETNMAFAGIKDAAELADLLAFLQKSADAPTAFPQPK